MQEQGLIHELRERRIWRVLIAYPVLAFGVLEALAFFIDNYDLDPRVLTAGLIMAIVLFPAAVLWNWRHGESGAQAVRKGEVAAYLTCFGLAVLAASLWYRQAAPHPDTRDRTAQAAPLVRSIAVMPLQNVDGIDGVQYLCDGIAESLTNWLSNRDGLRVASRSAAFRLRDEADPAVISEALDVEALLEGRLEQVGDQWVVSMSLVSPQDDTQLWGTRLVKSGDNFLALEQDLVRAIQEGLSVQVFDDESERLVGGTNSPEAYEHFLRGHYLIQSTEGEALDRGLEELRRAIAIDPSFARAYADIADTLAQKVAYGQLDDERLIGEARTSAYTAVALAPDLSEAQTAVGTVAQYIDMDWAAADEAYQRAISLGPTSTTPFNRFSEFLVLTQRPQQAIDIGRAGLAMDPLDSGALHGVGIALLVLRRYDEAEEILGEWNRYYPGSIWSHAKHALALSFAGRCEEAARQAAIAEQRIDEFAFPLMDSWLAWGHSACDNEVGLAGRRARIEAWAAENPGRIDPGTIYLAAIDGDVESLVTQLEWVLAQRDPFLSFVRLFSQHLPGWGITGQMEASERYQALLAALDLPEPEPGVMFH